MTKLADEQLRRQGMDASNWLTQFRNTLAKVKESSEFQNNWTKIITTFGEDVAVVSVIAFLFNSLIQHLRVSTYTVIC